MFVERINKYLSTHGFLSKLLSLQVDVTQVRGCYISPASCIHVERITVWLVSIPGMKQVPLTP